jgi:5,10-methenyltetrahydromethanopterin hydrogenase
MIETEIPFTDRLSAKHIVDLVYKPTTTPEEKGQYIANCAFYELNRSETEAVFSLTQDAYSEFFHVRMNGVKVLPAQVTAIIYAPKWLMFLVRRFAKLV